MCLNWFARHIKVHECRNPVTVWYNHLFDMYNFMPLDSIKSRTVSVVSELDGTTGSILFVSPYFIVLNDNAHYNMKFLYCKLSFCHAM